jgi:septation ring formation regulator EzrA
MARAQSARWTYDRFRSEYDKVMQACLTAQLTLDGLEYAIDKLEEFRANLTTIDHYRQAGTDIDALRDIMRRARQAAHQVSPLFSEASRALSRANWAHGTPEERVERARTGMAEIAAIAERASDPRERARILQVAEPLALLIDALKPGRVVQFPSSATQPAR